MRNGGKNRQRRGLPPPCGIHPAVLVVPASYAFQPWTGSCHIDGEEILRKVPTSLVDTFFYHQGLTLESRCSQLSRARHPAAGTPLGQGRPGHGNCPAIGPAARIAWCGGRTRRHSKGDGPNLGLTQFQPRTPGRSLGGNALSGFWFLLTEQKEPPAGSVPTRLASRIQGRLEEPPLVCPTADSCPRQGKSYA